MDSPTPKEIRAAADSEQRPAPLGLMLLLMTMSAIGPVSLNILTPVTPSLAEIFQTKVQTVQLTLSLYLVGLAISQLLLGPLSDRFGRRPVLILGLFITLVASVAAIFATSIHAVIFFRVLQALGASSGLVIGRAIIRDLYARERAASMIGLVTTVMVVAPMAAPLIGGLLDTALGKHHGWQGTFALIGLFSGFVMVWVMAGLKETRPDHITGGGLRFIAHESRELFASRRFLGYMLVCAIGTATFYGFLGGGPHVVISIMGRSAFEYGLWFIFTSGGFMLGNFVTARNSQRYGIDRMIHFGLVNMVTGAVLTVLLVAIWPQGGPWTIFVPQLLVSFGNGVFLPNCVAGAVSVRPQAAGTASGITGFAQMAVGAMAAQLMSHLVATAETAMPFAIITLLLAAAAIALFYWLLGKQPQPQMR